MTKKQRIEELEEENRKLRRDIGMLDSTDVTQRCKINELSKKNFEQEQKIKNLEFINRQLIIGIGYSEDEALARLVLNLMTKYHWHY